MPRVYAYGSHVQAMSRGYWNPHIELLLWAQMDEEHKDNKCEAPKFQCTRLLHHFELFANFSCDMSDT